MLAFISDTGIVVAVIAFIALFGASHIPKLARNLGEAGKEFRKAHADLESEPMPAAAVPAPPVPAEQITLTSAQLHELLSQRGVPPVSPS